MMPPFYKSVGAVLFLVLFVFDTTSINIANAAVPNPKTSPSTYEEDCYQLKKWADFLRTKIDPTLLDYALYQCKLVTEDQAPRSSSGTFYDDFDYGRQIET
uniref:Secreted protein n=1 Tax=Romanomermis culicivorax TaxID=13658 RepID=A0A915JNS4_ROMCU